MNKKQKVALSVATSIGILASVNLYQTTQNIKQLRNDNEVLYESNVKLKKDIESIIKESNEDKIKIINLEQNNKNLIKELDNYEREVSYNPYDLTKLSNVSLKQLRRLFKGTTMEGLEQGFIDSEIKYGVNAIFLASLVATESGWNDSKRAKDGSNNITGHAVYTDLSRGSYFNNKYDCILSTGKLLGQHYLNSKGDYYNGVSLWNVNQNYSLLPNKEVNHEWSNMINSIANDFIKEINK